MRLNRSFGYGDFKTWRVGDGTFGRLEVATPGSEDPSLPYYIRLYIDFTSDEFESEFVEGSVLACSYDEAITIEAPLTVDFYDE